jgi:methylmalonyl-CoA mutase
MGVNTFLSSKGSPTIIPGEVIRATEVEKQYQIGMLDNLHRLHADQTPQVLQILREDAMKNNNIFNTLMEVSKYCSLGQITAALFEVGGQYRRNM